MVRESIFLFVFKRRDEGSREGSTQSAGPRPPSGGLNAQPHRHSLKRLARAPTILR